MTFWDWFLGEAGAGWIVGILGIVVSVSLYLAARGRPSEPVIIRELDPDQPVQLTPDQFDRLVEDVRVKLDQYKTEHGLSEEELSFDPPTLPEHTVRLYAMKLAIGHKVRDTVLGGGGWAGSTMEGPDTFIDLAAGSNLLEKQLIGDIREFDWLARPGIFGEPMQNEQQYKEVIQLAAKIMRELEKQSLD